MSAVSSSKTAPPKPPTRSLPAKTQPAPAKSRPQVAPPKDQTKLSGEGTAPAKTQPGSLLAGLQNNYSQPTGKAIADSAKALVGTTFKPELEARCADFTSTAIEKSGKTPDGFRHTVRARDFGDMGAQKVQADQLQAGDVVAFNDTWRKSGDIKDHTHVGVYVGDGQFVHRPTNQADYLPGSKPGEVIQESLEAYLKRDRGGRQATLQGGYRFP